MVEEAELSLSRSMEGVSSVNALVENETLEIDGDLERVESIKAAAVSALVGTLAGVPISLSQATSSAELILHLTIIFISCALFGVTFRYTIRRDLDNIQLKTGTSAAFAFTKGIYSLLVDHDTRKLVIVEPTHEQRAQGTYLSPVTILAI
ncbi:hypothetical protein ACLOJK_004959 [Asimina triloba]